jgi:hypothetical protein
MKGNMRVLVFGSRDWVDYNDVIRNITLLLDDRKHYYPEDKEYVFIHTGMDGAENMVTEYIGKTEKFLRQKGYKIKEEIVRDKSSLSDLKLVESGIDFGLIIGDSKRNTAAKHLLELTGIPYKIVEE